MGPSVTATHEQIFTGGLRGGVSFFSALFRPGGARKAPDGGASLASIALEEPLKAPLARRVAERLLPALASALVANSAGCAERAESASDDGARAARAATATLPASHVLVCGCRADRRVASTFYDSCKIFYATTKQFQAAASLPNRCV